MRVKTHHLLFGVCLLLILAWPAFNAWQAGAQVTPPQPTPITDYANYPANSGAAPGCDATGVHGVEFTVNDGAPVFSLADIGPIHAGDILEVSYTDVSDACNTPDSLQPLSLAMKSARTATFDPNDDQALELPYAFDWMGPMGGRITYVLPNMLDDSFAGCFYQLDLVVGLPLAVVGPSGSFYHPSLRGDQGPNMLVSFVNGEYDLCVDVQATTTTTTAPEPTTTTTAPAPTTTSPEPTTTAPPTTAAPAAQAVAVANATATAPADDSAIVATRTAGSQLPLTGPRTWTMWAGGVTFASGLLAIAFGRGLKRLN